jgi:tetratricopeptide (TPR) repeat protein
MARLLLPTGLTVFFLLVLSGLSVRYYFRNRTGSAESSSAHRRAVGMALLLGLASALSAALAAGKAYNDVTSYQSADSLSIALGSWTEDAHRRALDDLRNARIVDSVARRRPSDSLSSVAQRLAFGGNTQRALALFDSALALDSTNADASAFKGNVLLSIPGMDSLAEVTLGTAVRYDGTNAWYFLNLAAAQLRRSDTIAATASIERARAVDDNHVLESLRRAPQFAPLFSVPAIAKNVPAVPSTK